MVLLNYGIQIHIVLNQHLNYGLERCWSIACLKGSNNVALGYDEGTMMIKVF